MHEKPFTPAVSEMLGSSFDAALKARHELTHLIADENTPFDTDKYRELSENLNMATQAFYQQLWSATQNELTERIVTEYVPPFRREVETVNAEILDEPQPSEPQSVFDHSNEKGL